MTTGVFAILAARGPGHPRPPPRASVLRRTLVPGVAGPRPDVTRFRVVTAATARTRRTGSSATATTRAIAGPTVTLRTTVVQVSPVRTGLLVLVSGFHFLPNFHVQSSSSNQDVLLSLL